MTQKNDLEESVLDESSKNGSFMGAALRCLVPISGDVLIHTSAERDREVIRLLAEQGKLNDNCKSRIAQSYFSEGALYFGKYVLLTAIVYSIY